MFVYLSVTDKINTWSLVHTKCTSNGKSCKKTNHFVIKRTHVNSPLIIKRFNTCSRIAVCLCQKIAKACIEVYILTPLCKATMPYDKLLYSQKSKPASSTILLRSSWFGCLRIDSAKY